MPARVNTIGAVMMVFSDRREIKLKRKINIKKTPRKTMIINFPPLLNHELFVLPCADVWRR